MTRNRGGMRSFLTCYDYLHMLNTIAREVWIPPVPHLLLPRRTLSKRRGRSVSPSAGS